MAGIVTGGIAATAAVIAAGVLVSIQPFLQPPEGPDVLLAFSIVEGENTSDWCGNLAEVLNESRIHAIVFMSGEVAKQHPSCVTSFDDHIDIGSMTYSYTRLTDISEYTEQLDEVKLGKKAVEDAGKIESRAFRAPYGETDENIYSLLSQSEIVADFSYGDRYHKYHEDKFIWFPIKVVDLTSDSGVNVDDLQIAESDPVQINIDNTIPMDRVESLIDQLNAKNVNFVNASELTGIQLTLRRSD